MPLYRVEFAIDVDLETADPILAAQEAWAQLTEPAAPSPVATVFTEDGDSVDIDLEEVGLDDDDHEPHDLECRDCGALLNNQCLDPDCTEDDDHPGPLVCTECQRAADVPGVLP